MKNKLSYHTLMGLSELMTFSSGMVAGMYVQHYFVQRRMKKMLPLVNNALRTIFEKMITEDLTHTELMELVNDEVAFLNIALP